MAAHLLQTLGVIGVESCATFPAVYLPEGSRTSQNTAERSVSKDLEPKPEVEIWRRPVSPTQRPRLPIRLRIHYGAYLAPLRLHRRGILTLAHCNGRGTQNIFAFGKSEISRFFQL